MSPGPDPLDRPGTTGTRHDGPIVARFGPGDGDRTPEAGRYRLVVARACPWSHRAVIARRLLGLESAISMAVVHPLHDDEVGWNFGLYPGGRDPVLGVSTLREAYQAARPGYSGGISVPALVDTTDGTVVTNDHPSLTLELSSSWRPLHRPRAPELLPTGRGHEIDELHALIELVAIAPYRAGFADGQREHDEAVAQLFAGLDTVEGRLSRQRFLLGGSLSEPDLRLWPVLVRLDPVYRPLFRCSWKDLSHAYPALWGYARDLLHLPGFGDTLDLRATMEHYFGQLRALNPSGVVPRTPDPGPWLAPHGREALGGHPFGDGEPPPPPEAQERVTSPWVPDGRETQR
ncbi:glutathione S-transferase C-terminal domain-containing protein [Janibacter alkaliphilus]|uniref:Putative glutathione S-transferase n=1 Tax=Janibacter alkaliphilus TaxID=1069963 RepID=A0A852X246_9MICO|nr:glutathione S-transferase C-terminal domain-containing protein [Janibacter alkaliphilus]NYG36508.1 putative glutathione S-transferase [Janibacter alkaliphilus]